MSRPPTARKPPLKEEVDRVKAARPDPERARRRRLIAINLVAAVVVVAGVAWLVGYLKKAVAEQVAVAQPERPKIVFVARPNWMSDYLAGELAEICRPKTNPSVFDRDALAIIHNNLKANPWISKVKQIRRVYGSAAGDTIEVDCDFRAPLALVRGGNGDFWFVDAKGVRLPEKFSTAELSKVIHAKDGKVNLRVIDGVRNSPPKEAGQLWPGDDLQSGLELAAKLNGQQFAEEIERIDVSNYNGRMNRNEAYLVLVTRHDTRVLWGRPWSAIDAFVEVKPEVKFDTLRRGYSAYGRVDMGQPNIDLRFDGKIPVHPPAGTTQASWR
jgi:hypothetical protein